MPRFCQKCGIPTGFVGWCEEHRQMFYSIPKLAIPSEQLPERRGQYHEMFYYSYETGQALQKSLLRIYSAYRLPFLLPWVLSDYGVWHLQQEHNNMVEYILHRFLPDEQIHLLEREQQNGRIRTFEFAPYPY